MSFKKPKVNKKAKIAVVSIVIIAVMALPMFYSLIYLGSVWNVYGNIDKVPVAFVNLDKTVTKDGKEYAIGNDLEENLKDSDSANWQYVDLDEAMDGVNGTKYYAVIEIPEDFSQKIANIQDGQIDSPEVIYISNKGKNFVYSQISSKLADGIKTEISKNLQKEISKSLVDSLVDVKVSIKTAADGTTDLQAGTQKLLDGSSQLSSGLQTAANGSSQLKSGLSTAADSTSKLQAGTEKLLSGSNDLSTGLSSAAGGSKQLQDGLNTMANGESQVVDGSTKLVSGLNILKASLTQKNDQIPQLVKGASDLNTNVSAIAQGANKLDTSTTSLVDAINSADSSLHSTSLTDQQKLNAAMSILDKISKDPVGTNGESQLTLTQSSVHQLSTNLQKVQAGTQGVSSGVSSLAQGIDSNQAKAAEGVDKLIAAAQGIQSGSSSLLTGLNTVSDKTGDLTTGLDKLSGGSVALTSGLKAVNDGNESLTNGLYTAAGKTGDLSDGLFKLSSGANSLENGISSVNDGTSKLGSGLNSGYDTMNDKIKFNSDDMSSFISEPVTVQDDSYNKVDYYGEGLAPYFMSLSLWIGAMVFNLVFSFIRSRITFKSKFMNSYFGVFLAGSIVSVLQAVILSFSTIHILGLEPASVSQFYFTNIIVSVTFFSIFYGAANVMGIVSNAIMFVILLLQLASSGGTFPIETAPAFYRVINSIVPMTYSVSTLRMTISGINQSLLNHNIFIILMFAVGFLVGGFVIKAIINFVLNAVGKKRTAKINRESYNDSVEDIEVA